MLNSTLEKRELLPVYNSVLAVALETAQRELKTIFTSPEILQARINNELPFNTWYIPNGAEYASKGSKLAVIEHGTKVFTPDTIRAKRKNQLDYGFVEVTDDELKAVLEESDERAVVSIKDLRKNGDSKLPRNYVVVIPLERAAKAYSGRLTQKEWIENDIVLAKSGSVERASAYFKKATETYRVNTLGSWHRFNEAKDIKQKNLGRLSYVGGVDFGGLDGVNYFSGNGRFVGVRAVGAQKSPQEIKTPTLEEILRVSKPFVADSTREDFEKTIIKLYQ